MERNDMMEQSVKELKAVARRLKVDVSSFLEKAEIVEALVRASEEEKGVLEIADLPCRQGLAKLRSLADLA